MTLGQVLDTPNHRHLLPVFASRKTWWLCYALLLLAITIPILMVEVPPVTDYINHFARDYVLAFSGTDKFLGEMYEPDWRIIPNLAMDLVLPPLMKFMPPFMAGKIVVWLALVLPVTGTVAIHQAFFRIRSYWPLATGLFAYNGLFLFGFINFQIAMGLAFWSGALWIWLSGQNPYLRTVLGAVTSLVCFISHLFGLIILILIVGSCQIDATIRRDWRDLFRTKFIKPFALDMVIFIPAIVAYFFSQFAASQGGNYRLPLFWYVHMLLPVYGYSDLVSSFIAISIASLLILLFINKFITLSNAGIISCTILIILYIALPFGAKQGAFINSRCMVILPFLFFAFSSTNSANQRWTNTSALLLSLCVLIRLGVVTTDWFLSRQDVKAARDVLSPVPSGARVLVAKFGYSNHDRPNNGMVSWAIGRSSPAFWAHYGAFAVIDRNAYWPGMFAYAGQQPLLNRAPYDRLAEAPGLRAIEPKFLANDYSGPLPQGYGTLFQSWRNDFDFLFVLNSTRDDDLPNSLLKDLTLEKREGGFSLFRISHPNPSKVER